MFRHVKWFSLFLFCQGVVVSSLNNFVIKRLESCCKDNSTKFYIKISHENGRPYLDFDISFIRPVDQTIGSVCTIQTSIDGKTFLPLFTITEKDACKALNTYLGEFWYDLERAAQVSPGVCPIPKRRYYVHHHLLEYNKISLQTFPFGILRITFNAVDNNSRHKDSLFCVFADIENKAN